MVIDDRPDVDPTRNRSLGSAWTRALRYETQCLYRSRHSLLILASAPAVTCLISVVFATTARSDFGFNGRDFWAVIATQGGNLGEPPLFAFVLAIFGVLVWSDDVAGDSAIVAYLSFPRRGPLALLRSTLVTVVTTLVSLSCFGVAILTALALPSTPPASDVAAMLWIKAGWTIVCGVGMAHLGAALAHVFRSTRGALAALILVPWVIEPLFIALTNSLPGLHFLSRPAQFLPFQVTTSVLGSTPGLRSLSSPPTSPMSPHEAAALTTGLVLMTTALVQWRYMRHDATRE